MVRQLLVGGGVSVINIAIHALVMTILVWVARAVSANNKSHPAVFLITVMISTVSVLMAAHAVEVFVWALAYLIVGLYRAKSVSCILRSLIIRPSATVTFFRWSVGVCLARLPR